MLHAKIAEHRCSDCSEWANVRKRQTVEQAHERRHYPVAHPLLERDGAPRGAIPTRAEDQIGLTSEQRGQDQWQFGRIVVAIAVKESKDVGVTSGCRASQAGGPIAPRWLSDHTGAGAGGDLPSAVSTAIVHDDDLIDEVPRYLADDAADGCLLVQRRDHHADPHGLPPGALRILSFRSECGRLDSVLTIV